MVLRTAQIAVQKLLEIIILSIQTLARLHPLKQVNQDLQALKENKGLRVHQDHLVNRDQ
jgi:hypothetical protein